MLPFTRVFLAALAAATALRVWLAIRQMRHVAAHRDRVPAAFATAIDLAAHRRAADYTIARTRLALGALLADAAWLLLLTLGGGLDRLDAAVRVTAGNGLAGDTLLLLAALGLSALIEVPFHWLQQFRVDARFGFNRMTPALFWRDLLQQTLLGALLGGALLLAMLWVMRRAGDWWWLDAWGVWMAVSLLLLLVWPRFIAPLFNTFTPLEDAALKARVEALLGRCGFEAQGLYVMDGSKRSSHGNAYFTGFGRSRRIVLYDTLLAALSPEEIEAVLAHELGHFHHRHVRGRMLAMFAISLAGLALAAHLMHAAWFFSGLNVADHSQAMALLLLLLISPVFTFLLQPLSRYWSRRCEYEADAYAAGITGAAPLAAALVALYRDNAATLTPDPLHSLFHDSHPPAALRVGRLTAPDAAG